MEDPYKNITHVVHISTGNEKNCEICGGRIIHYAELIDHYINEHGYRLLHVGSEWSEDSEGASIHHTVAVLGKETEG